MSAETCASCRFFYNGISGAEQLQKAGGMCRRYAPSGPAVIPSGGTWQVFPPMVDGHWCGDYRPAAIGNVAAARQAG